MWVVDVVWGNCAWDGWYRLGELRVEWVISFGVDCVRVVLFVCWENGAHEPTPSVLYFCQPRVD